MKKTKPCIASGTQQNEIKLIEVYHTPNEEEMERQCLAFRLLAKWSLNTAIQLPSNAGARNSAAAGMLDSALTSTPPDCTLPALNNVTTGGVR